ncbi:OmpA family protein [Pedobacter sp. AW31-3R]|uniref:OmpA family protein n=1 Tax=Pedobacter sp. AW31-3R TaxID=3445781 RepID=UPI003F9ED634
MKITKNLLLAAVLCLLTVSLYSCKSKKLVTKPTPAPVAQPVETKPEPAPVEEKKEEPVPVAKPNFNFSNVQFEFDSSVLKTASYTVLDNVASEMKKDTSVKFVINGNSSAEGSAEHNMSLSVDRANSVKSYLVNAGLPESNFTIKGFGDKVPVAPNDTEEGRELNRRVEIKVK